MEAAAGVACRDASTTGVAAAVAGVERAFRRPQDQTRTWKRPIGAASPPSQSDGCLKSCAGTLHRACPSGSGNRRGQATKPNKST
jgi:hypothetical protein